MTTPNNRPLYILLPKTTGGYLMQEECCWTSATHATPSLALHLAAELQRQGRNARLLPVDLTNMPPELDGECDAEMIFTWAHGPVLRKLCKSLRGRVRAFHLLANPEGCFEAVSHSGLASETAWPGADHGVSAGVFKVSDPLPLNLLKSRSIVQPFSCVLYQVSTGCKYHCPFCVWQNQFEVRDPEISAIEISNLYYSFVEPRANKSANDVLVLTNEITGRPEWLKTFCSGLPKGMTWTSDINVRNATFDDLQLAHEHGLRRVCMGIEFLTDSMMKKLGKGHTVEEAFHVMTNLKRLGIRYRFSLRAGVGETPVDLDELLDNLRVMADAKPGPLTPDFIRFGPMVEWPGYRWLTNRYKLKELVNLGTECYPRWTLRLAEEVKAGWREIRQFCIEQGWTR